MACRPRIPVVATAAVLACGALTGCGSSNGSRGTGAPPPEPAPTASVQAFPAAKGMTLADLQKTYAEGPILAPSVSLLEPGTDRVGFALFDRAQKQLRGAAVALYTGRADGTGVRGPFVARAETLAVKPQFISRQSAEDPDGAKGVYVAEVPFPKRGRAVVLALARLDGKILSTAPVPMKVGTRGATPPGPGQKAILIHTLTGADVAGNLAKIDTRIPPAPDLHAVDFADVLGKKPVVLTFATPQLCQSRVCGPVVDIVEQVKAETGDGVAFIHQEIYRDNQLSKGVRPQVAAWHLASEPWTFAIDRHGVISDRLEGAVSVGELERAVAKVRR